MPVTAKARLLFSADPEEPILGTINPTLGMHNLLCGACQDPHGCAGAVDCYWEGREVDQINDLPLGKLYGGGHHAEPDFYLPKGDIYVEVKGYMTLHQVTKMLYLTECTDFGYYVAQYSEEDWNPTIASLITPAPQLPDSTEVKARKNANIAHQVNELVQLARNPAQPGEAMKELQKKVSAATAARLRAYVKFFDDELQKAGNKGLLG